MTSPRPEGTFFKGASKVGLQGARWPWVRGVIPERCDPGRMRASASILSGFVRCCVDALVSGEAATGPPRAGRAGAAQASLRRLLGGGRAPVTRPPAGPPGGVPSGAGGGRARRRRRAAAGAPRAARLGAPACRGRAARTPRVPGLPGAEGGSPRRGGPEGMAPAGGRGGRRGEAARSSPVCGACCCDFLFPWAAQRGVGRGGGSRGESQDLGDPDVWPPRPWALALGTGLARTGLSPVHGAETEQTARLKGWFGWVL